MPAGDRVPVVAMRSRDDSPSSELHELIRHADGLTERWQRQHQIVRELWCAYEQAVVEEQGRRREIEELLAGLTRWFGALASSDSADSLHAGSAGEAAADDVGPPLTDQMAVWRIVVPTDERSCLEASPSSRSPSMASAGRRGLAFHLLGSFRAIRDGRLIDGWPGTKPPRVVRYIVAQRGRPVPREVLIELFWPDCDIETGRRNLHQTIYQVRSTLRSAAQALQVIVFANDAYFLNTEGRVWLDVAEFELRLAGARAAERNGHFDTARRELEAAEQLYLGDFLEDTPYEEWALGERDRLRLAYLAASDRLAELHFESGDVDSALEVAQRVLAREPCDESAHRTALRCHAARGQQSLIVRQFESCRDQLQQAFAVEPSAETSALFADLSSHAGSRT